MGPAGDAWTYREYRRAFNDYPIMAQRLRSVGEDAIDLKCKLLGHELALPVFTAPTGGQGMIHFKGELHAGAAGVRFLHDARHALRGHAARAPVGWVEAALRGRGPTPPPERVLGLAPLDPTYGKRVSPRRRAAPGQPRHRLFLDRPVDQRRHNAERDRDPPHRRVRAGDVVKPSGQPDADEGADLVR